MDTEEDSASQFHEDSKQHSSDQEKNGGVISNIKKLNPRAVVRLLQRSSTHDTSDTQDNPQETGDTASSAAMQSEEVKARTFEVAYEEQAALDKRIAWSKAHAIPLGTRLLRTSEGITPASNNDLSQINDINQIINSIVSPYDYYEEQTNVSERRINGDKVAQLGIRLSTIIRGAVLASPEYQAQLGEVRNEEGDLDHNSTVWFPSSIRSPEIQRGASTWHFKSHADNQFHLVSSDGTTGEAAEFNPTKNELRYQRRENIKLEGQLDAAAFLSEVNTPDAVAGVANMIRRYIQSGDQQSIPYEIAKSHESVWNRLVKREQNTKVRLAAKGIVLSAPVSAAFIHPSIETALIAGAVTAFTAVETWAGMRLEQRKLAEQGEAISILGKLAEKDELSYGTSEKQIPQLKKEESNA